MRGPGDVLLVSCYEPGHQPQGVASAIAHLRGAAFQPSCIDLAMPVGGDAGVEGDCRTAFWACALPGVAR